MQAHISFLFVNRWSSIVRPVLIATACTIPKISRPLNNKNPRKNNSYAQIKTSLIAKYEQVNGKENLTCDCLMRIWLPASRPTKKKDNEAQGWQKYYFNGYRR